ncbi:MAG: VWA domain-containing protein [Thermoanaerobaculia bacterium]
MAGRNVRQLAIRLIPVIALLAFPVLAGAATHRLNLSIGNHEAFSGISGPTQINVDPPFEAARITFFVDGQRIATRGGAPYAVDVDFGPRPIQHQIQIVITNPENGRRSTWTETINRGNRGLSLSIQPLHIGNDLWFEAEFTAPESDPVVSVAFFNDQQKLAQLTAGPWRIPAPPQLGPVLQATATTRSGIEQSAYFSTAGNVMVSSLDVRTVPLYVSVVDEHGKVRSDLNASDFKIFDGDERGRILEFGKAFDEPISIALVIDASASMTYQMPKVKEAAGKFMDRILRPGDRVSIFAIRSAATRELPLTSDLALARSKLQNLRADGKTALYDGIEAAIRELENEKNRRAIVLLSDGDDNSSFATFDEVAKKVRTTAIPIYSIAFGDDDTNQPIDRLKILSEDTGAFMARAYTSNLEQRYASIEKDLRSQYAIRYQVASESKENEWRPVRVTLPSPRLTARTIRGYFVQ